MSLVDLFSLAVPVTYLVLWGVERLFPVREFPARRGWAWLGLLFLVLLGTVSTVVPLLIPAPWLAAHRVLDLTGLGLGWSLALGYGVLSLVNALWHRAEHRFSLLWRGFHQMHHSPQRVDLPGSVLFHPLDMLAFAVLSVLVTTLLLGLDPVAAAGVGFIAAFYGMFQHCNIRTPQWLGYLIQRPESHCVHHERGVHAFNYSDFPLWDMLAGSFRNPRQWQGDAGFDAPVANRLGAMLAFTDVNAPLYGGGTRGATAAGDTAAA